MTRQSCRSAIEIPGPEIAKISQAAARHRINVIVGMNERSRYSIGTIVAVKDYLALEIPDNLEVAAQDPAESLTLYKRLDRDSIDGIVLSACVQMPSIAMVERESGIPTLSAAVATTWRMLRALQMPTYIPGCGALLSGRY